MTKSDEFKSKYISTPGYKLAMVRLGLNGSSDSVLAGSGGEHIYVHPLETQEVNFTEKDDLIGFIREMVRNVNGFIKRIKNMEKGDVIVANRLNENLGDGIFSLVVTDCIIIRRVEEVI